MNLIIESQVGRPADITQHKNKPMVGHNVSKLVSREKERRFGA